MNLAVHSIRARSSLILSCFFGPFSFYITLLVGVVGRKKRIVGLEMEEIGRSSITERMVFHILFTL